MSDATYQPKIYRSESGDTQTHKSGSTLELEAGATVNGPPVADKGQGIARTLRVAIANGTGNTDTTIAKKSRVVDVVVVKKSTAGGAGDQVIVQNAGDAITDAISLNVADKVVARPATIDDAYWEIAAAGTLRVAATKATNCACEVYVTLVEIQ